MGQHEPAPQKFPNIEIPDDSAALRAVIATCVEALQGPQKRPSTRERALAVTKLQEAFLWLGEDLRVN